MEENKNINITNLKVNKKLEDEMEKNIRREEQLRIMEKARDIDEMNKRKLTELNKYKGNNEEIEEHNKARFIPKKLTISS